jgi:hypothetical protein
VRATQLAGNASPASFSYKPFSSTTTTTTDDDDDDGSLVFLSFFHSDVHLELRSRHLVSYSKSLESIAQGAGYPRGLLGLGVNKNMHKMAGGSRICVVEREAAAWWWARRG